VDTLNRQMVTWDRKISRDSDKSVSVVRAFGKEKHLPKPNTTEHT